MTFEIVIKRDAGWDETEPSYGFGFGFRRRDNGPNCAGLWLWLEWGSLTRTFHFWTRTRMCTRKAPHVCGVNGPCNGFPRNTV